ncbi:hypothetical protein [Rossellomorea marisflavi]|uniref:hypothetical protein n=1 Tax=Rossellomorea marisflavi TaxID=189381 RepID=UPI003D2EA4A0
MKRKALDSDGNRGKLETPEAQLRRLDFLPAESKHLQWKGTVNVPVSLIYKEVYVQDLNSRMFFLWETPSRITEWIEAEGA